MKELITSEQLSLLAKEDAINSAERGANPDWLAAARRGVKVLAHRRPFLTSDDVWTWLQDLEIKVEEPRAMGSIMAGARNDALIAPTSEFLPSARPACHRRPQRVWKSLIYQSVEDQ